MELLNTIISALVGVAATLLTQRNSALRDLQRTWKPIYLKVARDDPEDVVYVIAVNALPIIWDVCFKVPQPGAMKRLIGPLSLVCYQTRRLSFRKKGLRIRSSDPDGSVHAARHELPTVIAGISWRLVWGEARPLRGWFYWNDEPTFSLRRSPLPVLFSDEDPAKL